MNLIGGFSRPDACRLALVLAILAFSIAPLVAAAAPRDTAQRRPPPNVLLIVADDLGYSDIGAYGSEIETPNLDALARRGATFSSFYVASTCSPTRSMLMTGADNHRVGFGVLAEARQPVHLAAPGYEGHLSRTAPTLAERFRAAGYRTLMAGKWHLGEAAGSTPWERGFDHSYSIAQGASSHFDDGGYMPSVPKVQHMLDGRPVAPPAGFYSSDFFTDRLIAWLDEPEGRARPFFAYLALTAPHYPLHAPRELIEKNSGRYADGWDLVRARRAARLARLGLVGRDASSAERAADIPDWASLAPETQRFEARRMAVYAAMIERLDADVGRLLSHLEAQGRARDTIVVFLSDNGPEASELDTLPGLSQWFAQRFDNSLESLGGPRSFVSLGPAWAGVAAMPFSGFKGLAREGGVRAPLIVAGPTVAAGWRHDAVGVADLSVTLLALAGVDLAQQARLASEISPDGVSFERLLRVAGAAPGTGIRAFESYGGAGVVEDGRWKALRLGPPWGDRRWRLYDLASDPAESRDLGPIRGDQLARLSAAYDAYAARVGVVPPEREPMLPWGASARYDRTLPPPVGGTGPSGPPPP